MSIRVVSLFSGGGGLDLGFKNENYEIIWAIDNQKSAVDTYKQNIGNHIIHADINAVDISMLPSCDIIIGGPPCQSFSLSGNRKPDDPRGQLVWKYIEIIDHLRPKAFVFENVIGLMSAKAKNGDKVVDLLLNSFGNIGYTLNLKVLNAADYGVPQVRKRIFIIGMEKNVKFNFPLPTHSVDGVNGERYITTQEALGDLPEATCNPNELLNYPSEPMNGYQALMRDTNTTITEHVIPQMSKLDEYIITHVNPGGNYMDIPPEVESKRIQRLQRDGGHTTCYGRLKPDKPSYTINTNFNRPNVGCNIHYSRNRLITVREALRLQSFPDSFMIVSSSKQAKHSIVGNAVPPILAQNIARTLKNILGEG